jgi:hypothetical protein
MGRGGPRPPNPDGKVNLVHLDADVTSDDANIMNIQERTQVSMNAIAILHDRLKVTDALVDTGADKSLLDYKIYCAIINALAMILSKIKLH